MQSNIHLEPAAVAVYSAAMARVSDQLASAAATFTTADTAQQLATDLGSVGADFARDFAALVDANSEALALGGHLVGEYGHVMSSFTHAVETLDADTAALVSRARGAV